jgi:hypothetical protein
MKILFPYFLTILADFRNGHYQRSASPAAPAAVQAAAWLPLAGPPPLLVGFWLLAPRPRCAGGSCPESQSGGGHGLGMGGGGVGCPFASPVFLAGAGAGMTDSRRARLEAGSPS